MTPALSSISHQLRHLHLEYSAERSAAAQRAFNADLERLAAAAISQAAEQLAAATEAACHGSVLLRSSLDCDVAHQRLSHTKAACGDPLTKK